MTGHDLTPAHRLGPLLAGFFVGFASVSLTLGVFWPFAPVFPLLLAGVATLIPLNRHVEFAKGALIVAMGVAVFEVVFVVLMFTSAGLR